MLIIRTNQVQDIQGYTLHILYKIAIYSHLCAKQVISHYNRWTDGWMDGRKVIFVDGKIISRIAFIDQKQKQK